VIQPTLFAGCEPEVAAGVDGRILAVGEGARSAAGRRAEVVRLRGRAWPGLVDAHIHLEGLADRYLGVDLEGAATLEEALARITTWSTKLPDDAWVAGRGWYNDLWGDRSFPTRRHLDAAAGGRPTYMERKDGHSAWVSSAALKRAGIDRAMQDPPGGVIDRDKRREPTGILRENAAMDLVFDLLPRPEQAQLDDAMARVLEDLARLGLTAVHSMDTAQGFGSWQRLRAQGRLPIRIVYNLPLVDLLHAERMGVRSGWGDEWLRIWGVKAFLDGSLGSRTAEMLDGSGTPRLPQADLVDLIERAARAGLNVCLHAIGDGAVRRALDALATHRAGPGWRPRIEHAQCVDTKDVKRFARVGVIASMQPIHAVADRELVEEYWPRLAPHSYAWGALARAGARLVFGSDAPVETADPLAGIEAATVWRRKAKWHPELAVSRAVALRAYTAGAAYAVGMEKDAGTLRAGKLCDLTVVDEAGVVATIVGGKVSFLRTPLSTSRRSSPKTR